jgi:peptide/nickel transport system permease protein
MITFLIRRLLQIIPTIFIISIILFALLALKPGNPIDEMRLGNPGFTQADYERLVSLYGYDQPWYFRYWKWLGRAIQGDWGPSIRQGVPAMQFVFESRLPNTALLSGLSLFFAFLIAVPLGIFSALRQHSFADYGITIFNFIGVSIQIFWLGRMLIFRFSVYIRNFLPAGGMLTPGINWPDWNELAAQASGFAETFSLYADEAVTFIADRSKRLVLPVFSLTFLQLAAWTRFMRSSMLEVINMDFIRTARAKGLVEKKIIMRHALRNAILPIITLVALSVPILFSGAVLTESVFNWPGMGRAILDSINQSDFNIAMASLMFISILILAFNLLADIAYALIDPRIRYD